MKYSSFKKEQLLFENWRGFLTEQSAETRWNPNANDYDPPLRRSNPLRSPDNQTFIVGKKQKDPIGKDPVGMEYPLLDGFVGRALSHALKHNTNFTKVIQAKKSAIVRAQEAIKAFLKANPEHAGYIYNKDKTVAADSEHESGDFRAALTNDQIILNTFDMINDIMLNKQQDSRQHEPYKELYQNLYDIAMPIAVAYIGELDKIKNAAVNVDIPPKGQDYEAWVGNMLKAGAILFRANSDVGYEGSFFIIKANKRPYAYIIARGDDPNKYVTGFTFPDPEGLKRRLKSIRPMSPAVENVIEDFVGY